MLWKCKPGPSEPHLLTILDFDSRPEPCEEPHSDHSTVRGIVPGSQIIPRVVFCISGWKTIAMKLTRMITGHFVDC